MLKGVLLFYNELPSWAKGAAIVGGGVMGAVIGFTAYKEYKKYALSRSARLTIDGARGDIRKLAAQGIKPSYGDAQYHTWADQIQAKFDGCDVSVGVFLSASAALLSNILKNMKNNADVLKLIEAWGSSRTYDACGWFMGEIAGTLPHAIADELSYTEIARLNSQLRDQKITFQF